MNPPISPLPEYDAEAFWSKSRTFAEKTAAINAAGRITLEEVARRAERFGTPVATMKDGKPAQVTPAEFRRLMGLPEAA